MISLVMTEGNINEERKQAVRKFILDICKGEIASWPPNCALYVVKDGTERKVRGGPGYTWQETSTDLIVGTYGAVTPPDWAPGTLLAISYFYDMGEDIEVQIAIKEFLYAVQARTASSFQVGNILARKKLVTNKMAVNPDSGQIAVWFEAEIGGQEGSWRLGSGEIVGTGPNLSLPWLALQSR